MIMPKELRVQSGCCSRRKNKVRYKRPVGQAFSLPEPGGIPLPETAFGLSRRQQQVLELLSEGLALKEIALRIGISRRMVNYHTQLLLEKLQVQSTGQLVGRAVGLGVISLKLKVKSS